MTVDRPGAAPERGFPAAGPWIPLPPEIAILRPGGPSSPQKPEHQPLQPQGDPVQKHGKAEGLQHEMIGHPFLQQHFLNFLPLLQGQGSLGPILVRPLCCSCFWRRVDSPCGSTGTAYWLNSFQIGRAHV